MEVLGGGLRNIDAFWLSGPLDDLDRYSRRLDLLAAAHCVPQDQLDLHPVTGFNHIALACGNFDKLVSLLPGLPVVGVAKVQILEPGDFRPTPVVVGRPGYLLDMICQSVRLLDGVVTLRLWKVHIHSVWVVSEELFLDKLVLLLDLREREACLEDAAVGVALDFTSQDLFGPKNV